MKNYDRALLILSRVMGMHRVALWAPTAPRWPTISAAWRRSTWSRRTCRPRSRRCNNALEIRTKTAGPLDPSLVPDLDRLAGAHIAMRAYDKAEEAYRHALVIRETLFGKDDADLIATRGRPGVCLFRTEEV